jgi:NTP pyrophosphatase (non-canonical NTP hydrolase)
VGNYEPNDDADRLDAMRHGKGDPLRALSLTFEAYQRAAWRTALPTAQRLEYLLPGLTAEVGEMMDVFAKAVRDQDGYFAPADKARIESEAGDILWFLAGILQMMNLDLATVAQANLDKLASRQQRGKLGGSGDER